MCCFIYDVLVLISVGLVYLFMFIVATCSQDS